MNSFVVIKRFLVWSCIRWIILSILMNKLFSYWKLQKEGVSHNLITSSFFLTQNFWIIFVHEIFSSRYKKWILIEKIHNTHSIHPKSRHRKQMKISSILAMCLCSSATGAIIKRGVKLVRSVRGANFREALAGSVTPIEHLMRRTLMQDESTFYDIILSGAGTLSEVNEVLSMRDPHFVKLSQDELDTLIEQWLFQMLAK